MENRKEPTISSLTQRSTDGYLGIEVCKTPSALVEVVIIKQNSQVGNIFHKKKTATAIVTLGSGRLYLIKVNEDGQPTGKIKSHFLTSDNVVHIPPYTAYVFCMDKSSRITFIKAGPCRKKDPDEYKLRQEYFA